LLSTYGWSDALQANAPIYLNRSMPRKTETLAVVAELVGRSEDPIDRRHKRIVITDASTR